MRKAFNFIFIAALLLCGCDAKHNYQEVAEIPATCGASGVKKHYLCEDCGKLFTIDGKKEISLSELTIPATGQHVTKKVESAEALYKEGKNCQDYNYYYFTCSVCGNLVTSDYFRGSTKGSHNLEHHDADDTYDEYYQCKTCHKIIAKDGITVLPNVPYLNTDFTLFDPILKEENQFVINYLKTVDNPQTENNEIAEYLFNNSSAFNGSKCSSKDTILKWSVANSVAYPLTLKIGKDNLFSEVIREYKISGSTITQQSVKNLLPGTYYYMLADNSVEEKTSPIGSFVVSYENDFRAINTGSSSLANMRDIGSWESSFGEINYGLIYRSANWDNLGDVQINVLKELGMKTELDIRFNKSGERDHSTSACPIEGINFTRIGLIDNYMTFDGSGNPNAGMLFHSETLSNVGKIFNEFLTNENNYPFDFHCASGADRTGYLGLLLDGALGVKDEDIFRDYELTSFFISKRLRSDIIESTSGGQKIYKFNPNGINNLGWGEYDPKFGAIIDTLKKDYHDDNNDTISGSVIKFLKTKCNVTDQSLNKLRSIMIVPNND